ncbi:MAG: class I SAM-dependent methyltransferase [Bacteroidaceae bacterium]
MEKLNITHCPICGSNKLSEVTTCVDHYATGETFALYECDICHFRFTQNAPQEGEIGSYYETPDYISHSDTRKGLMNKVYHYVRSYMLGHKARLVIRTLRKLARGKLLDIGAGTGYFANEMAERGWEVTAAEKSEQARAFAQKEFGLHTLSPEDLQTLDDTSFDAITMWHVMEHIEHLNEEWEMLYRLLKPKGCLVIAVPNCSSADATLYKQYWAAYDVPRHLWHFTPDTMQRIAETHGFRMVRREPMPMDAFYISMLSEKYKGSRNYFIKGLLKGLKCYFKAQGHTERSSSVIYIFKKHKE